jgi:hypothetical protein
MGERPTAAGPSATARWLPTISGWAPLFSPKATPVQLRLMSAETSGPAILARYERFAG